MTKASAHPREDVAVLVTGASRGIGASTAVAFGREGAAVAVNYRSDAAAAKETCRAIEAAGGTAAAFRADLADEAATIALVEAVEEQLGPIEVLVNNAALMTRAPFLETSLGDLSSSWETNVRGVYQLSQLVARGMAERGSGSIVHVGSVLATVACANASAYITTKGALEALTRAMAVDLARFGIRVNCVAPGLVATDALLENLPEPEVRDSIARFVPEGRFADPAEIAEAVLFLASDKASYMNGAIVAVDGGLGGVEAGPVPVSVK